MAGLSLRSIINPAAVQLLPQGSPEGDAARKAQAADAAFRMQWTAALKEQLGDNGEKVLVPAMRKAKLTADPIAAYTIGREIPAAVTRAKLTAMRKQVDAVERPLLAKWLKLIPD